MRNQKVDKKSIAVGFLFVLGAIQSSAYAESDSILGDEPTAQAPIDRSTAPGVVKSSGISQPVSDSQWWIPPEKSSFVDRGRVSLTAQGGVVRNNYSLGGVGLNSTLPSTNGLALGGALRYKAMNGFYTFGVKYSRTKITDKGLPSVTPADVPVVRTSTVLDVTLFPFKKNENIGLTAGYAFIKRQATETSPNPVISNYTSSGPLFGADYHTTFGERMVSESAVRVMFPSYYEETSGRTGYRTTAYVLSLGTNLFYGITDSIAFGLGVNAQLDSVSFIGTGNRGVTDANEKDWNYTVPAQLRFYF
jgi:hypothetical protein